MIMLACIHVYKYYKILPANCHPFKGTMHSLHIAHVFIWHFALCRMSQSALSATLPDWVELLSLPLTCNSVAGWAMSSPQILQLSLTLLPTSLEATTPLTTGEGTIAVYDNFIDLYQCVVVAVRAFSHWEVLVLIWVPPVFSLTLFHTGWLHAQYYIIVDAWFWVFYIEVFWSPKAHYHSVLAS